MYGHTYRKSKDQSGKIANPARGQPKRKNNISLYLSRLIIWSRETGSAVPSRVSLFISKHLLSSYRALLTVSLSVPLNREKPKITKTAANE